MKYKIFSALNRTHPTWANEMALDFLRDEIITNEFEGGVTLQVRDLPRFRIRIMRRFDTSTLPEFQVRVEREVEKSDGVWLLVLRAIDACELELYNQVAFSYEKFIPEVSGQTNTQIPQA